jgi:hypothetical protein
MHQSIAMASTMKEVLKIHNDKSDTTHDKITTQNGFNTDFAKSNFIMIRIIFQPGWGNKTLSFRELNKGNKQNPGLEHYSRPRSRRTLTRHPKTWVASRA